MNPTVVVDVGNSRMKWGLCRDGAVADSVSLGLDGARAWENQARLWGLSGAAAWSVTGVQPAKRAGLIAWLNRRGYRVREIRRASELPLRVRMPEPDKVGIDRLLNAVAVRSRVRPSVSAFIVDVGTAVTVDWVDGRGAFRGGAIFPGPRLMSRSLHQFTALLPVVDLQDSKPELPGTATRPAIKAGVYWAVAGGIKALLQQLVERARVRRRLVFLTGGYASLLAPAMDADVQVWPTMTLEGIRLASEALP